MTSTVGVILGLASYAFVMLSVFRLFRVNYFNPIVKIFATYLEPISKNLFFFLPPLFAAIAWPTREPAATVKLATDPVRAKQVAIRKRRK